MAVDKNEASLLEGNRREAEIKPEAVKEAPEVIVEKTIHEQEKRRILSKPAQPAAPKAVPVPKDPVLQEVETILAEGLEEVYKELPVELRPEFKVKGEETAQAIQLMIEQAKVKANNILKLIIKWLKMIPGVNRFFLEQEAAIKTQRIVNFAKSNKNNK